MKVTFIATKPNSKNILDSVVVTVSAKSYQRAEKEARALIRNFYKEEIALTVMTIDNT